MGRYAHMREAVLDRSRRLAPSLTLVEGIAAKPKLDLVRGDTRLLRLKVQMTSGEFKTALRAAGFSVENGLVVDVSETCPGFATMPVFRGDGSVDRNGTLSKITLERHAEIARRARSLTGAIGPGDLAEATLSRTVRR
jgi:hypothetical protein